MADDTLADRQEAALSTLIDAASIWISVACEIIEPEQRAAHRQALIAELPRLAIHLTLEPPRALLARKTDDGKFETLFVAVTAASVRTVGNA